MRFDISILWIDDTPAWEKQQQELFELQIEDYGLLTNIDYEKDVNPVIQKLASESGGFRIYDMIFVDYNISSTLLGNEVINKLRSYDIDADILFYSANASNDIKNIIIKSNGSFEGIYISNRDDFQYKALSLYKKNIRNLMSLSNIRGFLTDKTSENDYILNSYILRKYNDLPPEQKIAFVELVKAKVNSEMEKQEASREKYGSLVCKSEININQLLRLPAYILPLESKYALFEFIQQVLNDDTFANNTISNYVEKIVKKRNTVAHKKLDVCKQQKYIKYYDNIIQFEARKCPESCDEHDNNEKISVDEWQDIVKVTNVYSQLFDKTLTNLNEKDFLNV